MRVLLLYQPVDGGVARHVVDLFNGLQARNHEAVLCGPALPRPSRLSADSVADAPFLRLSLQRAVSPGADAAALRNYVRIVRRFQPDLVHAHSSKAGAVARLGKLWHPKSPVLYTPHGYAFSGFFRHRVERSVYREVERGLAPLTRFVIAVCEAEARLAASVTPAARVRVVYNGIDARRDLSRDPRLVELRARGPVICTLSRLIPGKGVETLIDALPRVLLQHPGVQVAIVGDGPLGQQLVARARARNVEHAVHFLGEHGQPMAVLQASDIFVMPSWAESFPYVVLEAMAAGIAIVSTDVGGIPEALTADRTGLLVARDDPDATSEALLRLLGDVELRQALGRAAAITVSRFSHRAMVEGVQRVYEEAVEPLPAGR